MRVRGYEMGFHKALQKSILPGHVVWDVGANIGLYSQEFSEWAGPGEVYSFEPIPYNADILKNSLKDFHNVTVLNFGLGKNNSTLYMINGVDDQNSTARIVSCEEDGDIPVKILSGDHVFREKIARIPNVIKIDVEGFEFEVLLGMDALLTNSEVKGVFVEVHFSILDDQGLTKVPKEIEKFLTAKGFHVNWVGYSHIAALRS
jgi:FkbM family methyltransferase